MSDFLLYGGSFVVSCILTHIFCILVMGSPLNLGGMGFCALTVIWQMCKRM